MTHGYYIHDENGIMLGDYVGPFAGPSAALAASVEAEAGSGCVFFRWADRAKLDEQQPPPEP